MRLDNFMDVAFTISLKVELSTPREEGNEAPFFHRQRVTPSVSELRFWPESVFSKLYICIPKVKLYTQFFGGVLLHWF